VDYDNPKEKKLVTPENIKEKKMLESQKINV